VFDVVYSLTQSRSRRPLPFRNSWYQKLH